MSSLSKHKTTLKRLEKVSADKNPTKYVSVVYMDNYTGKIDWPDNPNPAGVLVAPKPMSIEEWESFKGRSDKIS